MKLWNVDHYDHYQTIRDSDGNEVQAIIKCEMEKNTMNSYITTQGTVKVVNPQTNGTIRKQGISLKIADYEIEKRIVTVAIVEEYEESHCKIVPLTEADFFPRVFVRHQGWCVQPSITLDKKFLSNIRDAIPHPVAEAYQTEHASRCKECSHGVVSDEVCDCCGGEWQDCKNCLDGTGNDTADLLASIRL